MLVAACPERAFPCFDKKTCHTANGCVRLLPYATYNSSLGVTFFCHFLGPSGMQSQRSKYKREDIMCRLEWKEKDLG